MALCSFRSYSQVNHPNTLLWRIAGNNLQKPSYLFGTMHLKDARIFNFTDSLYHYLEQSEGFAMEIDPELTIEKLLRSLSEPDTSGLLHESMDKEAFKRIAKKLEKQFGIPANKITVRQAWLYKLKAGYGDEPKPTDMDTPVDTYLYNIARKQGKWVGGIEDVEDQFNMFEEIFNAVDFEKGKKKQVTGIEKMIQLYIAQDLNGIERWIRLMDSVSMDRLLIKRNGKMSRRIDSLAHIRSSFFAVGAAHLPGEEGVIQLLKNMGYRVEPVISHKQVKPSAYQYTAVDIPWVQIKDEESLFSVLMPGKANDFYPAGEMIKTKIHTDVGTGLSYFAASVYIPGNRNKDSVLAQMAANYSKTSRKVKSEKVVFKDMPGMALMTEADGYYSHLRFFVASNHLILLMVGSEKKAHLTHPDALKFFESLAVTEVKGSTEWVAHEDKQRAYTISFPGNPFFNEQLHQQINQREGADAWHIDNLTFIDPVNQSYYILVLKETKPGYVLISDEEIFQDAKNVIQSNPDITMSVYKKDTTKEGIPLLWIEGQSKSSGYKMKACYISKGNRSFSLISIFDEAVVDTLQVARFFNSFKLLEYELPEWKRYSDSLKSFTTLAPSAYTFAIDSTSGISYYTSFDNKSSFSYYVQQETMSPYYWATSDSALFTNAVRGMVTYEDSLLLDKDVIINGVKGKEYKIRLKQEARNFKHGMILLNGDTLYNVYVIVPFTGAPKNYENFLKNFQFTHARSTANVFTNKAVLLLNDLGSSDTIVFAKAKEAFEYAPFTKADLPVLHKALLKPYLDFDPVDFCIHDKVVDQVASLADSTTVQFIADHFVKVEREELKYPLLNILARIKTKHSYELLSSLLRHHRPGKGFAGGLAYNLSDSLQLTSVIIRELLPLFDDAIFAKALPRPVNSLLDSGLLNMSIVSAYEKKILEMGKRLIAEYEQNEGSVYLNSYEWVNLIRRFNSPSGNSYLKELTKSRLLHLKYAAVEGLIKNRQLVDAAVLESLAADNYYRLNLYNLLAEHKKLSLFPVKYNTQKHLAQSIITQYLTDDDYEPKQVSFLTTKQAVYKGKPQTFYLFKVEYETEDSIEAYLGVVGPFENKGGLKPEAEVVNISADPFNTALMQKQLMELLAEYEE